ncbi:hypothetical protein DAI18_12015 [Microvirgula aerodenitrificans]|uniref:Uncharacterized protein n=1 Tax=Microvirgula aerodenitrificans TaxID=57480 RepID=A0A2S0PBB3_9NEIS|nr:GGDEF and EAL domain-containing protein [Microvirgula aerodenitrificans]AVY94684.1 hypothetical protein DAI18_12015 [Microvirgula aerodenitrificans]
MSSNSRERLSSRRVHTKAQLTLFLTNWAMKMNVSLRWKILAGSLIAGALAAILASVDIHSAVNDLVKQKTTSNQLAAFERTLKIASQIPRERNAWDIPLTRENPATLAQIDNAKKEIAKTDALVNSARQAMIAAGLTTTRLDAGVAIFRKIRVAAQEAAAKPRKKRPHNIHPDIQDGFARGLIHLTAATDEAFLALGKSGNSRLVQAAALARLAQEMRTINGIRAANLAVFVYGEDFAGDRVTTVTEESGAVALLAKQLEKMVGDLGDQPKLVNALAAMRTTLMIEGEQRFRSIINAAREGRPCPISAVAWHKWVRSALDSSLVLRDAALDVAHDQSSSLFQDTVVNLVFALTSLIVVAIVFAGTVFRVNKMVIHPLTVLTGLVRRLANNDLTISIPRTTREDEIGELTKAIVVFRESAIQVERLEAELHATQQAHILSITNALPDIVAVLDTDLRYVVCNPAYVGCFQKIFGEHIEPGMLFLEKTAANLPRSGEFENKWRKALSGESFSTEWKYDEGVNEINYDSHYGPIFNANGELIGAFHIGRDITQRKKDELELRKLSMVVEQGPMTVVVTDAKGNIQYVNKAFTETTGYQLDEVLGENPRILSSGMTPANEYSSLWTQVRSGRPWTGRFRNKKKDGGFYWEDAVIFPILDETGSIDHIAAIKQDVTKRLEAEEHIAFLASHDELTRLPNRLLSRDRMEQSMVNAHRENCKVALFFIDLDRFKWVNDSLGHLVGDALLRMAAERIKGCIREADTLGRQGGDEFLVILSCIDDFNVVNRVATRILEQMAEPFFIDGVELFLSVSIGVSVYPDNGRDFDTLLKRADSAMYLAKDSGRNTYRFFTEQSNVDANEYVSILGGLRKALERNEFVLHYQPQIDLAAGQVVGFEALIRWNSPQQGLVPPRVFIPVAEDSGLIIKIGEWVLQEACLQAAKWQSICSHLVVAVNLSAFQFKRGNILQCVQDALTNANLDPSLLELELTESILIKDTDNILATIKDLKALGVRLSIDDFGTGYSSLTYLRQFNADKLKIDQSFVRGATHNADDNTIIRAIAQMAREMGMKSIAEGVEDAETLDIVRSHGCDEVQGYYFAKPLPADEVADFLTRAMPSIRI